MLILTSWDDGHALDFRLAALLKKYNLPGMFFIPTCTELSEDDIKKLSVDFQIGGHTETHPMDMKLLDDVRLKEEIFYNKQFLEDLIGRPVKHFCYPRGRYDDRTIEMVKSAGYISARGTVVTMGDASSPDPFRAKTSIHCFHRDEYNGDDWLDVAKQAFLRAKQVDGVYHIWGHSAEIERHGDWEALEELFNFISQNR